MVKTRDVLAIFNRGRISRLAVARTDVARVALSAEVQTNWIPRTLGSMMVRPGLEFIGEVPDDGAYVPFIFSNTDHGIIELTPEVLRFWDSGTDLVTRLGSTAVVSNGSFTTDLSDWNDADAGLSVSDWDAGRMRLVGTNYTMAKRRQNVTCLASEEVSLRIVIARGPVRLRIGTGAAKDDIFRQSFLRTGTHSIAFTPGQTDFWIEFASSLTYPVLVDSCVVETAGILELPTPWDTVDLCKAVRWQESADVVFCACAGMQQRRIERRPNNSWSVVLFEADDGPFLTENVTHIRLTPDGLSGEVEIEASRDYFRSDQVGGLIRIASQGQRVEADLVADLTYTDPIRVTGVEEGRIFTVTRAGTWVGTLSLQRSLGEPGTWVTVATYTTNGSVEYDDELDNSIAFYRIGFESGGSVSGTAEVELTFATGSITGTARIIAFTDSTHVDAIVIVPFGETTGSEIWWEGAWSDRNGWPEAVAISEGRLWWSGIGQNWASVPDSFTSYDPETIGDSQPISRRNGEGAINATNWILALQNLIMGTDGAEVSVRSTSFEEPITPPNYNAKARTAKGSAPVPAVSADNDGYFVGRTAEKLYGLIYDPGSYAYKAEDFTLLCPEMGLTGFKRIAAQMNPDMRLHCVRNDGTVAILVRDPAENVLAWVDFETDGVVEDVVVLPGEVEDAVFYRVLRDGGRFHERWAAESQARGGVLNCMADSFVTGTGPVTGLDHLEGQEVVIWGDSVAQERQVVSGGVVTGSYDTWCVGLPYQARYKSAKLAGQTALGLSITQRSRINSIGLVLADTHAMGVQFGQSFDVLDSLPLMEDGVEVDAQALWTDYDKGMVEFPGDWLTDSRVCLVGAAPYPCTVLAVSLSVDREDAS